jgi:hypothetical protein
LLLNPKTNGVSMKLATVGVCGDKPDRSAKLIGSSFAYRYRLVPPISPIGSRLIHLPSCGLYNRISCECWSDARVKTSKPKIRWIISRDHRLLAPWRIIILHRDRSVAFGDRSDRPGMIARSETQVQFEEEQRFRVKGWPLSFSASAKFLGHFL